MGILVCWPLGSANSPSATFSRSGGTSALIMHGRTGLSMEPRWASSKKSFTFTDEDEAQV